jgi:hypothetical protein
MGIVETSQRLDYVLVLRYRLLGCWVVYCIGAHYGYLQGLCMPLTSILSAAAATLGWVLLRLFCHQIVSPSSACETPSRNQHNFGCVLPILACVLDCACRDKHSW